MVVVGWVVQRLPPRLSYEIAALIADVVFAAWPSIRRRTVANMRWVDPARAEARAAAAFRNYFRYMVEFLRFPGMGRSAIERAVEVRGVEHLHAAMALGRGAVAVGFHIGNIDLGAAVLAQVGYPVNVVVDTFRPPRLDALIQGAREAKGLKLIPLDQAPRRALRVLRSKEILALLMDRPAPPSWRSRPARPSCRAWSCARASAATSPKWRRSSTRARCPAPTSRRSRSGRSARSSAGCVAGRSSGTRSARCGSPTSLPLEERWRDGGRRVGCAAPFPSGAITWPAAVRRQVERTWAGASPRLRGARGDAARRGARAATARGGAGPSRRAGRGGELRRRAGRAAGQRGQPGRRRRHGRSGPRRAARAGGVPRPGAQLRRPVPHP